MKTRIMTIASILATLALAATASGQSLPDVSGTWRLDLSATLESEIGMASAIARTTGAAPQIGCSYVGQVTLTQDGSAVSGPTTLALVDGGASCPAEMIGDLSGTLSSGDSVGSLLVNGTIDGTDPGGNASFSGTLSSESPGVAAFMLAGLFQDGSGGSMSVNQGPFAGATGSWSATFLAPVPTLTPVALLVLVILLLAAGALMLRRDSADPADAW